MIESITNAPDDLLRELSIYDPNEIAEKFNELKIKGKRMNITCCPVSNYLSKNTGLEISVGLKEYYIIKRDENGELVGLLGGGDVPKSVQKFITKFDTKRYPELIDDER